MQKRIIGVKVNGRQREAMVDPSETLLDVLRNRFGLMGAKRSCGEGKCGACTVLLNGEAVNSCLVLAVETDQCEVVTVEGLANGNELHPLQTAFIKGAALQCGYCTPGMLISAKALLDRVPSPNEDQIREGLSGNLCRCTGYGQVLKAVKTAAESMTANKENLV